MTPYTCYDIIGIGIGPFNLGLAAMADEIPELKCLFIDHSISFQWHPGLLLKTARLQVPFLADLITPVNPQSRFTYLSYLHARQRLFRFAIHEQYFPTRIEYNDYCAWVTAQLPNLRFGLTCQAVAWDEVREVYMVYTSKMDSSEQQIFYAKNVVIGTGTVPHLPACASAIKSPILIHSGDYLFNREQLISSGNITIIGSGQSAGEIFNDLLANTSLDQLHWFTRAPRFFPMEYTKLSLEMVSPDYIDYFFHLPRDKKIETLNGQDDLYKGINHSMINDIYDQLYLKSLDPQSLPATSLHTGCDLKTMKIINDTTTELRFLHAESGNTFTHQTGAVIMATGYRQYIPTFLHTLRDHISWTVEGGYNVRRNYSIDKNGHSLFVQNADLYTHGFNSADLGMGAYRNAVILNTILGKEHFILEKDIAFQSFGIPSCNQILSESAPSS